MASKREITDINELMNEQIRLNQDRNAEIIKELSLIENVLNLKKRLALEEEYTKNNSQIANELLKERNQLQKEGHKISKDVNDQIDEQVKSYKDVNTIQTKNYKLQKEILKTKQQTVGILKMTYKYLNDNDKIIRQTILNLGMSSAKAAEMRLSFEDSAAHVARLGGSLTDVQAIMQGYAEETGRARVLSSQMVTDVYDVAKGTGLGIEATTQLAAQYEAMGLNATSAMQEISGIVETSELMGVNTQKVLKNISDNFRRLQRFTFRSGVEGFAKMATYAEKFHIDMTQTLDSAEGLRNLENAVDAAANLQVLGGSFASADPLRMMFAVRNEPEEFQKMITDMVRGITTFREMADGSMETFISPADQDRLRAAEKSLGLQTGELDKQARRLGEIQRMRQQVVGMGLSDTEKSLIEGMYVYNNQLDKFTVQVAGAVKDVRDLNKEELKILDKQSKSLIERAEKAQTFDEVFQATIEEFKTILLPLLQHVNTILTKIRPIADSINEWFRNMRDSEGGWLKVAGTLLGAAIALKTAGILFRAIGSKVGSIGKTASKTTASRTLARGTARSRAAKGIGGGIGTAALGIGAGIGLAAVGIAQLAEAMSGLDEEQAKTLKSIVMTLGLAVGIVPALVVGLAALSPAALAAAPALLTIGGAVALVGAGIGAATAGIGLMRMGMAKMIEQGKGAGPGLKETAKGIRDISLQSKGLGASLSNLASLNSNLRGIAKRSKDLEDIGDAFDSINTVLSGSRLDFQAAENAITKISQADLSNLAPLAQLRDIINKPLKVEFADKEIAMVTNITLDVDGYKFNQKIDSTGHVSSGMKGRMRGIFG